MSLELATANRIIEGCIAKAQEIGKIFSIAVVDEGGHLVAAQRMDGSNFVTPDAALGKAYACAATGRDGERLLDLRDNHALFVTSLIEMTGGKFVAALGTKRIISDGKVIGAVGVAGGTAPGQDQEVAEAGIAAAGLAG